MIIDGAAVDLRYFDLHSLVYMQDCLGILCQFLQLVEILLRIISNEFLPQASKPQPLVPSTVGANRGLIRGS